MFSLWNIELGQLEQANSCLNRMENIGVIIFKKAHNKAITDMIWIGNFFRFLHEPDIFHEWMNELSINHVSLSYTEEVWHAYCTTERFLRNTWQLKQDCKVNQPGKPRFKVWTCKLVLTARVGQQLTLWVPRLIMCINLHFESIQVSEDDVVTN